MCCTSKPWLYSLKYKHISKKYTSKVMVSNIFRKKERKKKEEDFIMPSAILALLRQSGLTPCILDELYVSWIWRPVFTNSFEQSNVERRWVSHGAVRVWDRRWGSDGYRRRNKLWFSAAGFTDGLISCTATRVACEKVLWQRRFFSYA